MGATPISICVLMSVLNKASRPHRLQDAATSKYNCHTRNISMVLEKLSEFYTMEAEGFLIKFEMGTNTPALQKAKIMNDWHAILIEERVPI